MTKYKFWVAVLIAVLLLPNVAASADAAKEAYEKGKDCFDKGEYDAAIIAFTEVIRLDPKNAEAYGYRGKAYSASGNLDMVVRDCNEAIRLNSKLGSAYAVRGGFIMLGVTPIKHLPI